MRASTALVTSSLMGLFVLVVLVLVLIPGDPQGDPPFLLLIPGILALSVILKVVFSRGRREP